MMKDTGHITTVFVFDTVGAGHAEMADQAKAVIEMRNQIFGASFERHDVTTCQPLGKLFGERKAQIGTILIDGKDRRALHDRLQSTFDRLNFW
jgi:uncharacterized protein